MAPIGISAQRSPRSSCLPLASPDSRLLIKVEQRAGFASAELFSFAEDDAAIGPVDLLKVIDPVLRAKMKGGKDERNSATVFTYKPAVTISDQGLIRAAVYTSAPDTSDGPVYEVTLQLTRTGDTVVADVVFGYPLRRHLRFDHCALEAGGRVDRAKTGEAIVCLSAAPGFRDRSIRATLANRPRRRRACPACP